MPRVSDTIPADKNTLRSKIIILDPEQGELAIRRLDPRLFFTPDAFELVARPDCGEAEGTHVLECGFWSRWSNYFLHDHMVGLPLPQLPPTTVMY